MGFFDGLLKKATDAIMKPIKTAIKPITEVVNTFERIICFMEAFPIRIRDAQHGIVDITDGIGKQIIATGTATSIAFDNISDFGDAIGLLFSTHSECIGKFLTNFVYCVFFYILDSILYLMYSIIYIFIWIILGIFISVPFGIPNPVDDLMNMIFVFGKDIHYPKIIRENCYICATLKPDVIKNKASNIDKIFKRDIPLLFGVGNDSIKLGANKINAAITNAIPTKLSNGNYTYYTDKK